MKNMTNTLNKLTKFLAVAIFSISLNAFSIAITPFITISTNHVSATVGTAITPVTITNTNSASLVYYSISPAISNGLSFNKKTGTISGVPIVVSDSVTYTVTAVLMARMKVDYHGQDTATVVIAVGAGTINLALGKPATQSSTFLYHSINPVAGYAVDGNTDGYFLNKSTTHTEYAQGAWWQVDLGSKKDIKQIIIYNRTDCCAARLSNYQVSISNKADFSTHTYQQDFHVAPNPKKIIQLDAPGKQGRYVRIQLLDSDYLSLAEVQVMGVDPLRFAEVDVSNARNNFGGFNNVPNFPNLYAFAIIQADRSIVSWGDSRFGGIGTAPTDSGYTQIYSNFSAFAALKTDGSITAWGASDRGGTGAPIDSGYTKIYSTGWGGFAAIKADGSITAWGHSGYGGTGAPSDNGYTKIYSTLYAFAALKADGSITAWGDVNWGGNGAPSDSGYIKIYSTKHAFAALKSDGSITAWGSTVFGGLDAPFDSGYTKIYSTDSAFVAVKADGTITGWGDEEQGGGNGVLTEGSFGTAAPSDGGYTKFYSTKYAFTAVKADGTSATWGEITDRSSNNYTKIYSTDYAFAALKADGSIVTWGHSRFGGTGAPSGNGYTEIYSTKRGFSALKADGSIATWGRNSDPYNSDPNSVGVGIPVSAPSDSGYIKIYSNGYAFAAVKADGTIVTWGDSRYGGGIAPALYHSTAKINVK
ncbi:lipoprotein, putative [uncultured Gammaproteobacteria bacterium]|jgi:alpha-tubulin suppressor-like RCC1 family protein|nr:lipoprotein, putative [uncultured Gammaproteobacteria bacterium]VVM25615.1 lipoprotein, putative [uncultured Gammaproteobacteria bacterium]